MVAHAVVVCLVVLLFHHVCCCLLCCEFQQIVTLYHERVSCWSELLMLLSDLQQSSQCMLFELMKHLVRSTQHHLHVVQFHQSNAKHNCRGASRNTLSCARNNAPSPNRRSRGSPLRVCPGPMLLQRSSKLQSLLSRSMYLTSLLGLTCPDSSASSNMCCKSFMVIISL